MSAESKTKKDSGRKLICTNPNAKKNFFIEEIVEAGVVLQGTEVKSLRNEQANLRDSFVEIAGMEAWLLNCHIAPYSHGNIWNHEPTRRRKLLLHKHQLRQLFGATQKKGFTLVPLQMYFFKGRVKIEIGLGKGKKAPDKRQDIKKRDAEREVQKALKQNQRK